MSNDILIRSIGLGKKYTLGGPQEKYLTFRDAIVNSVRSPFRKLTLKGSVLPRNEFWALKDVSFDVCQGELIGIIGRNGAGKSTLLKILSRITTPTEGKAIINGRVGSLLEVGTGFHPELTGRENIFLSGSILGMKKREIDDKFDEIVKFSEIEKFLDTPAKRYSSGMYVRLAFAVMAHLEPEILLIDEVLAVGDATFQKKCLGKMSDISEEGRTILFVSHNMGMVRRLCSTGIVLNQGKIDYKGDIEKAISLYLSNLKSSDTAILFSADPNKIVQIRKITILNDKYQLSSMLNRNRVFHILVEFDVNKTTDVAGIGFMLETIDDIAVIHSRDLDYSENGAIKREPGKYCSKITIPGSILNAGRYKIRIGIGVIGGQIFDHRDAFIFDLLDEGSSYAAGTDGKQRPGIVAIPVQWETEKIGS